MRGLAKVRAEQGFHGDGRDGDGRHHRDGKKKLPDDALEAVNRLDLGRRLKESAMAAGLTARDLADAFGKRSESTIRLWWREQTSPNPRDLILYAKLVGKSPDYFLGQPTLSERVLAVLQSLMEGQSVGEAIERVGGERLDMPFETRTLMEAGAKAARAALTRRAGGSWADLSPEARLALVEELMAEQAA